MSGFSSKEQKLLELLRSLPFEKDEIPNGHENGIIITMICARNYGLTDDFINIINANKGKSFEEIEKIITYSGLLPEVEFVDDDELDE